MILNKICTKCGIEKSSAAFSSLAKSKDGLRPHCRDCVKQYNQINKEAKAATDAKYRQANKSRISEQRKQQYQINKNTIAEYKRRYQKTSTGKAMIKAAQQKRRAIKKQVGGNFTGNQVLELFNKQNGKCVYCKTNLFESGIHKYHVDHIHPLTKGGNNDISNIQLLCVSCNCKKHNRLPEDFAQQFGMLI